MEKRRTEFCIECRKETGYFLRRKEIAKIIRDKEYTFDVTTAICAECGEEMSIPGIIDKNVQEIDEQYRRYEGLVTVEDIEKLMQVYKIGKEPVSLALGFGAVTVTRYLDGQVPSKEYSDIIKEALSSPAFMKQKLLENRDKLSETAFNKSMTAAESMLSLFSVSEKMIQVIARIFEKLEEATPLMLQKILYFIQGIYFTVYGVPIFEEDCQAWAHGPVYPEVYYLFKDFKYNPIDDARFARLEGAADLLTDQEKEIVDLVTCTFGMYGGKALERITHNEDPWRRARAGYADGISSSVVVTKESIRNYYEEISERYEIRTESGLNQYIRDMLSKTS